MSTPPPIPRTMRAHLYTSTSPTLEANLKLHTSAPFPPTAHALKPNEVLVRVNATSLNPVDYKLASIPLIGRFLVPRPASPCLDFAGTIVNAAASTTTTATFTPGQRILGRLGKPVQHGALGEYIVCTTSDIAPLPGNVSAEDGAAIGTAGLTAYQSVVSFVKPGDRVFINGGSGGTGVFAVQIAKMLGCHVTATCSGANVDFVKGLGADEVVDYRKEDVGRALSSRGRYSHVVDNVGSDPGLWRGMEGWSTEGTRYMQIGAPIGLGVMWDMMYKMFWPSLLGAPNRKYEMLMVKNDGEKIGQLAQWVAEGKIKVVKDTVLPFEQAKEGFERLRTGRARGKIVIQGAKDDSAS